ncbi:hypothetical protein KAR91_53450 [Candidatus Pacearchaeota archaeon]|nr:hypothetical protein [Candidatus Pacearchaeota archaeon]
MKPRQKPINTFMMVTYTCPECGKEKEGFRAVPESCRKCKVEMEVSTMQNHKVGEIRGFRHADKGDSK